MSKDPRDIDPDDFFQDTRMSFGDHLEDLRTHLWRAIKGFFFFCVFGFFIGKMVLQFIADPVEKQLQAFYDKRLADVMDEIERGETSAEVKEANVKTKWIKVGFDKNQMIALSKGDLKAVNEQKEPSVDSEDDEEVHLYLRYLEPVQAAASLQKAQNQIGRRPGLTTLSVQEAFAVYMKVSIVTGFVLGSPWIFYQIWSFIAVGLYPHEKRLINVYLPFSLGLFLAGVLVCEFLVMPKAVEALLWFNEWIGLEPDMRLNEWLGFAVMMPVVFGLSFQTPLVMLFLNQLGFCSIDTFRNKRRIIWFVMAIFAAVITPSTDPYSMLLLWVPMILLFELGIVMCKWYPQEPFEEEVPESEEVVEV